ncbi:MAG: SusC/RagA family TonB-linked outer membrane protein, partial [Saprospiraceae bacterium]|nr:SusC/RagA family TonB-linked outer membrane protein [Saprospiraceae bacterium]
MFRKFLSLAFLCISIYSFAQVSGTVKDNKGEPMIGVSVLIKGTDTGTVTDFDGKYELNVSSGTLIFSFVGYTSQEKVIDGQLVIDVALSEESTLLESVVVIGYGTQKKKDLTSAVVVVDEKSIKERPMVSAAEALQGKAAGVQVIQPSGKPGGDISVRVRGATSVLAGNEPLYVVDGVPTTDIRGLNPNDIATMTVLKDASSSSIYGARAANGVVLITTRRGKANTTQISFNSYYGISRLNKTIDVLSTRRYRELMDEIIPGGLDPTWTANTDWNQEVFGTGTNQSYQLSMSGGSEKSRYLLSGNYLKSDGIVRPASFERYSLRLNLDNDVRSWLSMGTNINAILSNTENTQDNASSGRGGVIMSALNTPPFLRIYKTDGSGQYDPNPFQPSWENPVAYMEGPEQLVRDNRLFGNT